MNKAQKQLLKRLLEDERFEVLASFYAEIMENFKNENVIGADNGETLKLTLMKEGKLMGLRTFFNNLEKEIYE